jgi:hypothetical protein
MFAYLITIKDYLYFLLVRVFIGNVLSYFGKNKRPATPIVDTKSPVYLEKAYEEKQLAKFLKSYDVSGVDFSENIEPAFYDLSQLSAILSEENNVLESKWKTRILSEYTPRGNILMYYDPFRSAFVYHSDQNSMPYRIINAAVMKYVITFRCRDFFMDEHIVPSDKVSRLAPKPDPVNTEPKATKTLSSSSSAFISPKMYHSTASKANHPQKLAEKRMNKIVHLGKMVNFNVLQLVQKVNGNNGFSSPLLPSKVISYEEYKRSKAKG